MKRHTAISLLTSRHPHGVAHADVALRFESGLYTRRKHHSSITERRTFAAHDVCCHTHIIASLSGGKFVVENEFLEIVPGVPNKWATESPLST